MARHTFQSFWWGTALSPYEVLCLKSFIACGHGFDLYTFDPNIIAPAGVRVCDASELIMEDQFFVYENGFGKGSPAAFANLFRYKLLIERGGWWSDTDIVCLSEKVPDFDEFFARQDTKVINNALLYFKAHDPVMEFCFDEAVKLGRNVRWGDAGPHLLTRALQQSGRSDRAARAETCYPLHWKEALEVLRPSQASALAERTRSSLFLHLWNERFRAAGVEKTQIPPKNSLLRGLIDRHQVGGWTGEYDEMRVEEIVTREKVKRLLSFGPDK
jgi:Alpha 1,4-glycosyltransferase conserved region